LNCNKYAFQIIKETTQLETKLLSTIVVPPVNAQELNGIILKRHKIGGAEVYYNNDLAHRSNKINKVTNRIHGQSNGNIGIALNLWLANINMSSVGELFVQIPEILSFPNIKSPEWKLVLYHFILHRKLSEKQLKEIMKDDFDWERNTLREMQKAGLVFKQPDGKYELNSMARFYIEKWLKTLSFIN